VAHRPQTGFARTLDEIALTGIFVTVVSHFLFDDSAAFRRTQHLLQWKLMAYQASCAIGRMLGQNSATKSP